jgi:hypothetical protein
LEPVFDYIGAVASRIKRAVAGGVQSKSEPSRWKMITFDYIGIFIVITGEGRRKEDKDDRHCRTNPTFPHIEIVLGVGQGGGWKGSTQLPVCIPASNDE